MRRFSTLTLRCLRATPAYPASATTPLRFGSRSAVMESAWASAAGDANVLPAAASSGQQRRPFSGSAKPFRVLVTRSLPEVALKMLREAPNLEVEIYPSADSPIPAEELRKRMAGGFDGLLVLLTDKVDAGLLDVAGDRLKIVSTMSVGFNHVDTPSLKSRGILLGYTPDCLTETTADLTVTLLLVTARRIQEALAAVKDGSWGTWSPLWLCGVDVHSSTVGIVGFGRIGQAVAKRLKAFGCTVLYTGPREKPEATEVGAEFVSEADLLSRSDFVIPMFPLTPATTGYFNASRFKQMKKSAILINATRGEAVNQEDLAAALKNGDIAGAGLDVTTPEPLPTDSPLLSFPNCVILPQYVPAPPLKRALKRALYFGFRPTRPSSPSSTASFSPSTTPTPPPPRDVSSRFDD
ncbi:D-isomer specific 2-hydroxyacid dehydrogenase [Baffinella frigidus]|nr:D-isomer specific 2-hydroxyacid dehydrogenase [Cryptophyta sp. CCMP2293]